MPDCIKSLDVNNIDESNVMLEVKSLKTYFYTKNGIIPAVDDVNLKVRRGKIVGLVGESGCGKSITALSILRLVPSPPGKIIAGSIIVDKKNILECSENEMCSIRGNEISMIFQEPMTSLNPSYTVGEQVMEALIIHQKYSKRQAREKTIEMFNLVGIPESKKRLDAYPHQLSGGLRQRVMIAMALSCRPKLLIADEPTTALDVTVQAQILELIKEVQKELNSAVILITHDLGVVAEICDDVSVMYTGRILEHANVYTLFEQPMHPYTSGLIKSLPKLYQDNQRLYNIPGTVPNMMYLPNGCKFHPRCEFKTLLCTEKEPDLFEISKGHSVRCWRYYC